jgi:outer membrane protein assembly factor BamA
MRILSLIFASLAFAAPAAATAQSDSAKGHPLVTEVAIRGVKNVLVNELRDGLATKGTACKSPLYLPICWITRSPVFTTRHYLDPLEFRRDVLRIRIFYWQRGYRDVTVAAKTERTSVGVRVIFDIDEQEPTKITELKVVQSDSVLPQRAIGQALQVKSGEPLNLIKMDSTLLALRDELWERGYAAAKIELDTTMVSEVSNGGPVTINIEPGSLIRVSEIQFVGNQKVSDRTMGRLLTFKTGDLFQRSRILSSQRSLYISGLFDELEIETPPIVDSLRLVRIRVTEADLNRLEVGGGFTTADFGQLDANFTKYNLIGSARQLNVRGTVANLFAPTLSGQGIFYDVAGGAKGAERDEFLKPTWSASVGIIQPWLFSIHNQLGISVFAHRRTVPGIVIDRGSGANLSLTRDFGPRTNSTLGYTYEFTRVDATDVYFCVSFGVCLPPAIDVLANGNVLAPISSVTQFDVANDAFNPYRGYRARIDLEHASQATGSDFRYNRVELTGMTYHRVGREAVLAFRARVGWVGAIQGTNEALGVTGADESVIHPRKKFYAGGSQSVRGFGERQLGPRVLTVSPTALTDTARAGHCTVATIQDRSCDPNIPGLRALEFQPQPLGGNAVAEGTVEYRFPLMPARGVTGVVFLDGAIIGSNQLKGLLGSTGAITPGFGIRMKTPVGPVRLDLGIRPTLVEDLPVVTQVTLPDGTLQLVTLTTTRRFDPTDRTGGSLQKIFSRLRFHLAIGPSF